MHAPSCFQILKKLPPQVALLVFLALYLGGLGFAWLSQTPSAEEFYGGIARFFWNFRETILAGPVWWSADYMQGHSAATMLICSVPLIFGSLCISVFGDPAGIKVAMLLALAAGSWGLFLFVRRLTGAPWTAFIAGVLYALSAQFITRIANFEHFMGSVSYVFVPFIFCRACMSFWSNFDSLVSRTIPTGITY